jgi:hypothetical protein
VGWAGGPSIDQVVAESIGTTTAMRSLELGVMVTEASVLSRMIYGKSGDPLAPESDPVVVFDRLFGAADPLLAARRRANRKSVLDGAVLHGLGGKHCGRTADGRLIMASIHPSAVVDQGADLDDDVEVGPFAVVGAGVRVRGVPNAGGGVTALRASASNDSRSLRSAGTFRGEASTRSPSARMSAASVDQCASDCPGPLARGTMLRSGKPLASNALERCANQSGRTTTVIGSAAAQAPPAVASAIVAAAKACRMCARWGQAKAGTRCSLV